MTVGFERNEQLWELAKNIAFEQGHYDAQEADYLLDVRVIYNQLVLHQEDIQ